MAAGNTVIARTSGLDGNIIDVEDQQLHQKLSQIFAQDQEARDEHRRRLRDLGYECIEVHY
jgi:hypothetical protein